MAVSGMPAVSLKEPIRLVFVGSPLLDVSVPCCDPAALGLKPDGCVRATTDEHHRLLDQLLRSDNARVGSGGSALNSAMIAKRVLKDKARVSFAGCVGNDDISPKLLQDLRSSGVEPLLATIPDQATGACACLLSPGGQRSMITRLGAASLFGTRHLEEATVRRRLREAHCIFVVGYFAGHSPQVVRALADSCSPDQVFSLSLSSEYVCREYADVLLDVLPRVDVLLCNESEIMALASSIHPDMDQKNFTIEDAVLAVANLRLSHPPRYRIVVVTRGPEPLILVSGNGPFRYYPVPRVKVVDSVGCGDALAGAFLATYALTRDERRAVEVGIRAAVRVAQVHGCELPPEEVFEMVTEEEIVH